MKTLNFTLIILLASVVYSCKKDTARTNDYNNPESTGSLSDLTISETFNWSSSIQGNIVITLDAPDQLHTEGEWVELRNAEDELLDRSQVKNGQTGFYISVPQNEEGLYAYYPITQDRLPIGNTGNYTFKLNDVAENNNDPELYVLNTASLGQNQSSKKSAGTELVINGGFESGSFGMDSSLYKILRSTGMWYAANTHAIVKNVSGVGNTFSSASNNENAKINQALAIGGNEKFDFTFDYNGNAGCYILFFNSSQQYIGYTIVQKSGAKGKASFLVPSSVKYLQVYAFASGNDWIDNVSLSKVTEPDTDNDGVPDRLDKYPNDPAKSYARYLPTSGRSTLAYEDLWPWQGDNDFNDLVISTRVEIGLDAQGNAVDAQVSVKVLAAGAAQSNGIALRLVKTDKTPFSNSIITSVSGNATADANVENGIIIANNIKSALSPFYTNTGRGADGSPQEFSFTLTFNESLGATQFLNDFYIYKTGNRGKETHLSGFSGTAAADASLFNTGLDVKGTYKTASGLPWAMEIVYPSNTYFHHPLEGVDICTAYNQFQPWAESGGNTYIGWMFYATPGTVYKK